MPGRSCGVALTTRSNSSGRRARHAFMPGPTLMTTSYRSRPAIRASAYTCSMSSPTYDVVRVEEVTGTTVHLVACRVPEPPYDDLVTKAFALMLLCDGS